MSHPIENLMDSVLKNIKTMVDVNTIIGEPIHADDGVLIIPVSRVAYGFGTGGSNFGDAKIPAEKQSFGGGAGGGITISPVAFLVVSHGNVRMITVSQASPLDKIIDLAPEIIDKLLKKFGPKDDGNDDDTVIRIEDDEIIVE